MDVRLISTTGYNFWSLGVDPAVEYVTVSICEPDIDTNERGSISLAAEEKIKGPIVEADNIKPNIIVQAEEILGPSAAADNIKPNITARSV